MTDYLIDPARYANITLAKGAHELPDEGQCLMEAVAYLVGEQHSDHPTCVSPVLGEFGRQLNDHLPDDLRQELKALIPSLPGTAGDGMDPSRSCMALDWLIRTWLPTWLDLVPACREDARRLRELDRIVDLATAERAAPIVQDSRTKATAAGAAAWAAAWDVARAAAWDVARDVAREDLAPTVRELQLSAIDLYAEMIKAPWVVP